MLSNKPVQASLRTPMVVGNWKMNKTYGEAVSLAQGISDLVVKSWRQDVEVVLCPPFTALRGVSNVLAFDHSFVQVGAQDCHWEPSGAFTGSISIPMLKDLDCTYCIVGHSERRTMMGETDQIVARKAQALCAAQVVPIVCVGEPREVYEAGDTIEFVTSQVRESLSGVVPGRDGICVAYEPIWAIGTGLVPSPEHAQAVASAIREEVEDLLGSSVARAMRVLYGGSVKPGNVAAFMACDDVDGVLVGGASLVADDFVRLVGAAIGAA